MYGVKNYINRGTVFLNNQLFPGSKKLQTLMIYATDLCDSACKHCLIWAKRPVNFMPLSKIKEIMSSKCISPQTTIGLEGGEFLLHPEALEILEWFTNNHKNFDLLSNGLVPKSLISAVTKFPPRRLYISLDGNKETYQHMRGKDGYDGIMQVLDELHDKLPISLMFTLSPFNDFSDMQHVAEICLKYKIDLRIGVYNDIAFFDTIQNAHSTDIGEHRNEEPLTFKVAKSLKEKHFKQLNKGVEASVSNENFNGIRNSLPTIIKQFKENYDFLVLYDEWRKKDLKLKCFSILDSLVILPNGDVPICQNLDVLIGNVNQATLDTIFNSPATQALQKEYVHNCNACWINFHRKYDVVLYRSLEKFFGKWVTSKMFGHYQWDADNHSYSELIS
jgi:MoaA/NifB/PqqE/SkfB family radical SAM enzyme